MSEKRLTWALRVLLVLSAAATTTFVGVLSFYQRLAIDDFCTWGTSQQVGPLGYADVMWRGCAGRWLAWALQGVLSLAFHQSQAPGLVTFAIAFMFAVTFSFLLRTVKQRFGEDTFRRDRWWMDVGAGWVFTSLALFLTVNLSEDWFWLPGEICYVVPLIFSMLIVALAIKRVPLPLCLLCVVLPAPFHELAGLLLLPVLVAGWLATRESRWGWMFLCACLAFVAVLSSPGYALHAHGQASLSITQAILPTLYSGARLFFVDLGRNHLTLNAASFAWGAAAAILCGFKLLKSISQRRRWEVVVGGVVLLAGICFLSWLPFWVKLGGAPPTRVFITASTCFALWFFLTGFFSGDWFLRTPQRRTLLCLILLGYAVHLLVQLPSAFDSRQYSLAYDHMIEDVLREKKMGRTSIYPIAALPDTRWLFPQVFTTSPGELWINGCFESALSLPFLVVPK